MKGVGRLTTRCGSIAASGGLRLRRVDAAASDGSGRCAALVCESAWSVKDLPQGTVQGVALDPQFRCRVNGYICVVAVSRLRLGCVQIS